MTPVTEMEIPAVDDQAKQLEEKALSWPDRANGTAIASQESYDAAASCLLAIKALRDEAERHHRPIIQSALQTHRLALEALNRIDGPLKQAEAIIKRKIAGYEQEQRRLQEEARRAAELEAERLREEEIEAQIEQAEAEGASVEEVQAIIEQPLPRPPVQAPATFQRAAGVATVDCWKGRVVSMRDLLKAILDGKAAMALVMPDDSAIRKFAAYTKGSVKIPGIEIYNEPTVRAGGRRF